MTLPMNKKINEWRKYILNNLTTKLMEINRIKTYRNQFDGISDFLKGWIPKKQLEILNQDEKIQTSITTHFIKNIDLKPETIEMAKELDAELYEYASQLDHYNPINTLVLIRRYMRNKIKVGNELNFYKKALKKLLDDIDRVIENSHGKLYDEACHLYNDIQMFIYKDMKLDFLATYEFLRIALANIKTMTKQEFLQLITLNHDLYDGFDGSKNNLQETLDLIPDVIGAKEFEELIFVHKVESDDDNPFFEIYFDNFVKVLDDNPQLSDDLFDKVQEIFGPIPAYSFNAKGELKQNKPNLTLVK